MTDRHEAMVQSLTAQANGLAQIIDDVDRARRAVPAPEGHGWKGSAQAAFAEAHELSGARLALASSKLQLALAETRRALLGMSAGD